MVHDRITSLFSFPTRSCSRTELCQFRPRPCFQFVSSCRTCRNPSRSYSARFRFHSPSFCAPSAHSHYLPHSPCSYLEPDRTSERPSHTCRYHCHFVCFRAWPAHQRLISLAEFCERYDVDDEDQGCLAKLKFQPGDRRIDKLERVDWHGHAGFSELSWDDFLVKHKQFARDVKAGHWA